MWRDTKWVCQIQLNLRSWLSHKMGFHEAHPGRTSVHLRWCYTPPLFNIYTALLSHSKGLALAHWGFRTHPLPCQPHFAPHFLCSHVSLLAAPATYHPCSFLPARFFPSASLYFASLSLSRICFCAIFWMRPFLTTVFKNCLPVSKSLILFPYLCIHIFSDHLTTMEDVVLFYCLHPPLVCKLSKTRVREFGLLYDT